MANEQEPTNFPPAVSGLRYHVISNEL